MNVSICVHFTADTNLLFKKPIVQQITLTAVGHDLLVGPILLYVKYRSSGNRSYSSGHRKVPFHTLNLMGALLRHNF